MNSTFCLSSNIVPQTRLSNVGLWFQLEQLSRILSKQYHHVYTISGPLWLSKRQYDNKIIRIDADELSRLEGTRIKGLTSVQSDEREILKESNGFQATIRPLINNSLFPQVLGERKQTITEAVRMELQQLFNFLKNFCMKKKLKIPDRMETKIIGRHCVHVPTHLFKIILCITPINQSDNNGDREDQTAETSTVLLDTVKGEKQHDIIRRDRLPFVLFGAFVVPNSETEGGITVIQCQRSVQFIEFYSGLDFTGLIQFASDSLLDELSRLAAKKGNVKDAMAALMLGNEPQIITELLSEINRNRVSWFK